MLAPLTPTIATLRVSGLRLQRMVRRMFESCDDEVREASADADDIGGGRPQADVISSQQSDDARTVPSRDPVSGLVGT